MGSRDCWTAEIKKCDRLEDLFSRKLKVSSERPADCLREIVRGIGGQQSIKRGARIVDCRRFSQARWNFGNFQVYSHPFCHTV